MLPEAADREQHDRWSVRIIANHIQELGSLRASYF